MSKSVSPDRYPWEKHGEFVQIPSDGQTPLAQRPLALVVYVGVGGDRGNFQHYRTRHALLLLSVGFLHRAVPPRDDYTG